MMQGNKLFNQHDMEGVAVFSAGIAAVIMYEFHAYGLQFGFLILLYACVIIRLVQTLGLLDARVLFFAISTVYSTAGSVDYYFFNDSGGYGELENATILLFGSTFMIASGALLIARARDTARAPDPVVNPAFILWFAVAALVLFISYVGLSVSKFGLGAGEFDRATLTSEQGTFAALARNFLVACLLAWTWAGSYGEQRVMSKAGLVMMVTGLVVFDLLYFGDRRIILCMLLGMACLRLNRSRMLPFLIPIFAVSALSLIVFSALREAPFDVWIDVVMQLELASFLTPVNLDSGGFPLIASDLLASSRLLLLEAPNYLDGLLATIPGGLYPSRPTAFSGWYVQTYHPAAAAIGEGKASNWVFESYVNMGVLGPTVAGFATAGLLNWICSTQSALGRLCGAAAIPAFAFVMRYDLTSFLQIFVMITMVAIALGHQVMRYSQAVPHKMLDMPITSGKNLGHQERLEH